MTKRLGRDILANNFAECADDISELGADESDDFILIDYDLEAFTLPEDDPASMQGPSEEAGSRPRASHPQGSGQDPSGSHQGGDDVPRADVSGPREQKDVVMADAAPERDAVINTVGGRAEGNPVAPTPLERPQLPPPCRTES